MLIQELRAPRLWDAFREMDRLQAQLNGLFAGAERGLRSIEYPPITVWVSDEQAHIVAEVPGVDRSSIDVSVVNEVLTIRGTRQPEDLGEGAECLRNERSFGEFTRAIQLPFRVDADKVEAKFKNGMLCLSIPRAESDKPRKISVKSE
jgi:HSP20 family protein